MVPILRCGKCVTPGLWAEAPESPHIFRKVSGGGCEPGARCICIRFASVEWNVQAVPHVAVLAATPRAHRAVVSVVKASCPWCVIHKPPHYFSAVKVLGGELYYSRNTLRVNSLDDAPGLRTDPPGQGPPPRGGCDHPSNVTDEETELGAVHAQIAADTSEHRLYSRLCSARSCSQLISSSVTPGRQGLPLSPFYR